MDQSKGVNRQSSLLPGIEPEYLGHQVHILVTAPTPSTQKKKIWNFQKPNSPKPRKKGCVLNVVIQQSTEGLTEEMVVSCLGVASCNNDVIFIYCNLVSTRWRWSVDLHKNLKETEQKEKQYTKQYKYTEYTKWKTKIQNKKKLTKNSKKESRVI